MIDKIGKRIYSLRKTKDLTQEKLAAELGVSIAAVSKWETGISIPDILTLCNIADYFDVSVDELLGRAKNRKRVMVVDDVEFIRDSIARIVSENGCEIVGLASDGQELLNLVRSKKADIIFLDINMPGMDGLTALEQIRKEYPDIKIFMCSAVNDEAVMEAAKSLGASGYITKPFLPEAIISSLEK